MSIQDPSVTVTHAPTPLAQGSEMARRIRAFDWAGTALGPRDKWSSTLRMALELSLGSRMCGCIYWGSEHLILYNDAYASILGSKHPWALGRTVDEVWPEILDVIGPLMEQTFAAGVTTGADDAPIFINRSGYVEEFYCSFSYSPVLNANGCIEAVFAILPETSIRVIGERRLRTLQTLGADAREAHHPAQTLEIAAEVVSRNAWDVPFAAFYSWRDDDDVARLCATANIERGTPLSPIAIEFDGDSEFLRLLREAQGRGYARLGLESRHEPIPCGGWRVPPRELLVLPFLTYGEDTPNGLMLAGVSPHKEIDSDHLLFFRMLADQITRSLAQALTHEQEAARMEQIQQRARNAQQAERLRIARDLHDTLVQSMQGMRFLLEAGIERARRGDGAAIDLFENALQASRLAIREAREVLSLLRSTAPAANNVRAALTALGAELVAGTEIVCAIEITGEERPLQLPVWNDAYSLCREAVANAVRHAQASRITITLDFKESLSLRISDDGCGIDAGIAATGRAGHFGLQGMRERSANIGAALDVRMHQGEGTTVTLDIPGEVAYLTPSTI